MSIVSACSRLRSELDSFTLPHDPDVPEHKKFYPKSRLHKFLSPLKVSQLLECACQRCAHIRSILGAQNHATPKSVSIIVGKTPHGNSQSHTSILLLALLLYIDSPALIFGFLEKKCYDGELESHLDRFSAEFVQRTYWPRLYASEPLLSNTLANKFRWSKYKFVLPIVKDGEFSVYDESVILPFINEKRIGREGPDGSIISEGAYGHIYSFEILDEYRMFSVSAIDPHLCCTS